MPITVAHDPSAQAVGRTSYLAGRGTKEERDAVRAQQAAEERRRQNLQAMSIAANYAARMKALEQQDEQFNFQKQQYENERKLAEQQRDYTQGQLQQLDKYDEAENYILTNPDGYYKPEEQQALLQQVREARYGIMPLKQKSSPYAEGQNVGEIWNKDGFTYTRDQNGIPKILHEPQSAQIGFKEQLNLKKEIYSMAKDFYEAGLGDENPITIKEAMDQAQAYFADIMPRQDQQTVQPQGNEETMADAVLRQVMSPQTYEAAKATGLPSKDIYYMTRQLREEADKSDPIKSGAGGDINKKDWMAEKENINEYRKRFAAGIPESQIQQAFVNDPYIESNNSSLADPDHKVTTPYAAWDELTDSQRDQAYERYLDENKMPPGDRFGMAVSKVISSSDYENYKKQEKKHKEKLLTKEQFAELADKDTEFLWQFVKVKNGQHGNGIDQGQAAVGRAIDSSRTLWR